MVDTVRSGQDVHNAHPNDHTNRQQELGEEHETTPRPRGRRGSINQARPRPTHIPRTCSESYPDFKHKQSCALRIGVTAFQDRIHASTGIEHIDVGELLLTTCFLPYSQSKLSQQELSDLQKATHFDKKELQQWYKGTQPTRKQC